MQTHVRALKRCRDKTWIWDMQAPAGTRPFPKCLAIPGQLLIEQSLLLVHQTCLGIYLRQEYRSVKLRLRTTAEDSCVRQWKAANASQTAQGCNANSRYGIAKELRDAASMWPGSC
mmetsp:Transcript_98428/g.301051  ORF Transcript_98428/g.301051 Transcript_98428/m.301051 type:complete len:116 (+) Transcript_98428:241-588(+)